VDSSATSPSLLVRIRRTTDSAAWSQFVRIYSPLIYRYCRRCGLQDSDAADITQNVMHTVMRTIGTFEYDAARGRFRGWLRAVTRSRINDWIERRERQPAGTGDTGVEQRLRELADPAGEEDFWEGEHRQCLFDWAVEQVRDEFEDSTWQAFWRTSVEGAGTPQVARDLGLSVGAVYVARSRVLARLREKIQQIEGDVH
jgi:RNA polymerase sigma-70 factor (ECF subfamily)